ncbi:hypothetical protein HGB48_10025 [Actinomadura latina]|uniref:Uncharacterized protein n=1 Tax=Actinomadura latina TaxID=163603 RepID=A0A846Z163_9ACTN|nr:hypothetical protein [Actinomadura latina]
MLNRTFGCVRLE